MGYLEFATDYFSRMEVVYKITKRQSGAISTITADVRTKRKFQPHLGPAQFRTTLESSLKSVKAIYAKQGFKITNLNMNSQFEPVHDKACQMGMTLNTVSANEHVPEIERCNRTIKERVRSAKATLPFKNLPVQFLTELVAACIFWLNVLPAHAGISTTMSPRTIITGMEVNYNKHCKIQTDRRICPNPRKRR